MHATKHVFANSWRQDNDDDIHVHTPCTAPAHAGGIQLPECTPTYFPANAKPGEQLPFPADICSVRGARANDEPNWTAQNVVQLFNHDSIVQDYVGHVAPIPKHSQQGEGSQVRTSMFQREDYFPALTGIPGNAGSNLCASRTDVWGEGSILDIPANAGLSLRELSPRASLPVFPASCHEDASMFIAANAGSYCFPSSSSSSASFSYARTTFPANAGCNRVTKSLKERIDTFTSSKSQFDMYLEQLNVEKANTLSRLRQFDRGYDYDSESESENDNECDSDSQSEEAMLATIPTAHPANAGPSDGTCVMTHSPRAPQGAGGGQTQSQMEGAKECSKSVSDSDSDSDSDSESDRQDNGRYRGEYAGETPRDADEMPRGEFLRLAGDELGVLSRSLTQQVDDFTAQKTDAEKLRDTEIAARIKKTAQVNAESFPVRCRLVFKLKNVRSLKGEDRELLLTQELADVKFDFCFLTETWRSQRKEAWSNDQFHFYGAGGNSRTGVAIVVGPHWASNITNFKAVNDRLCSVDVNFGTTKIRMIVVYMPNTWNKTKSQHARQKRIRTRLYAQLRKLKRDAIQTGLRVMISGDWNAVLGKSQDGEEHRFIGRHGMGQRDDAGQEMVNWLCQEGLCSIATQFHKRDEHKWTHDSPIHGKRQIDYAVTDPFLQRFVVNAFANDDIDIGSDHRSVTWQMKVPERRKRRNRRPMQKMVGWKPNSTQDYRNDTQTAAAHLQASFNRQMETRLGDRCKSIEQALRSLAEKHSSLTRHDGEPNPWGRLKELIKQRKQQRGAGDRDGVRTTGKHIQKEIRAVNRMLRQQEVDHILRSFKGLKNRAHVKKNGRKDKVSEMTNGNDVLVSDAKGIANAFADFYENLYAKGLPIHGEHVQEGVVTKRGGIPQVTLEELKKQLKSMKDGKSEDDKSVVIEFLKLADVDMLELLAQIFTDLIKGGSKMPDYWRTVAVQVLYKSGPRELPSNYRPICIVSVLGKLYSFVLLKRIGPLLDSHQSCDQCGFRPKYSTEDHLAVITILTECAAEKQQPLWVIAVDFQKSFDVVSRDVMWSSLRKCEVAEEYIQCFIDMYCHQRGYVKGSVRSRLFNIERGTRQGDPISPIILNCVLQVVLEPVIESWEKRGFGVKVGQAQRSMTNLRYADDILIVGRSLHQVATMLSELIAAVSPVGLHIHPKKTKVLSNGVGKNAKMRSIKIANNIVEIIPPFGSVQYLGRALSLTDPHGCELASRIRKCCAKFNQYKEELTSSVYSLRSRLRLFSSVLTGTMVYACSSWTLTCAQEQLLRTTQRKMLHSILGQRRIPDEDEDVELYVNWIRRCTHKVQDMMKHFDVHDWVEMYRLRK